MTTVNPFVFNTLNVKLCSHLIIVQTGTVAADTDIFQSALSSDTRMIFAGIIFLNLSELFF
jgi:hypothetical protein